MLNSIPLILDNKKWTAKVLTSEHNADNRSEVERIYNEHPPNERSTVIKMERLLGQLAPLRSLGDFRYLTQNYVTMAINSNLKIDSLVIKTLNYVSIFSNS